MFDSALDLITTSVAHLVIKPIKCKRFEIQIHTILRQGRATLEHSEENQCQKNNTRFFVYISKKKRG